MHFVKGEKHPLAFTIDTAVDDAYDYLVEMAIATEEEILLFTDIDGYTMETMNNIIYVKTGCNDIEQLKEE